MPEFIMLGVVMILLLGAYWTMVIFPRQRDFEKRQTFVRALAVGDEVVTYGGLIGKIQDIDVDLGVAIVEIADGLEVRFLTAALMRPYDPEEFAEAAQKGQRKSS